MLPSIENEALVVMKGVVCVQPPLCEAAWGPLLTAGRRIATTTASARTRARRLLWLEMNIFQNMFLMRPVVRSIHLWKMNVVDTSSVRHFFMSRLLLNIHLTTTILHTDSPAERKTFSKHKSKHKLKAYKMFCQHLCHFDNEKIDIHVIS